jgi:hypothetical protein
MSNAFNQLPVAIVLIYRMNFLLNYSVPMTIKELGGTNSSAPMQHSRLSPPSFFLVTIEDSIAADAFHYAF